ncbi:hypothetical protein D3C76_1304640 [compost metagenome]
MIRAVQGRIQRDAARDQFAVLDAAQVVNILLVDGGTHARVGIAFCDKGDGQYVVWNADRNPGTGGSACGFAFQIVQLVSEIFRGALELVHGS